MPLLISTKQKKKQVMTIFPKIRTSQGIHGLCPYSIHRGVEFAILMADHDAIKGVRVNN